MTTKWLTFDCYGTLVDWREGMVDAIRSVANTDAERLLTEYHRHEHEVQAQHPGWTYRAVLAESLRAAARVCGISLSHEDTDVLGRSLPTWPVFSDTNQALRELRDSGYNLGILSNVDREMLQQTLTQFDVDIDVVVASSDIGSYKPALGHFTTFKKVSEVEDGNWIHVACSWFHDVVPADKFGIPSVYINREGTAHIEGDLAAAVLPDLVKLPGVVGTLFDG
ncbi:HAD family hydrolase [Rhodococcus gordoniae]